VKVQSCLVEILPIVNAFFLFRPPARFAAVLRVFFAFSEILVTKNPFWRISCCASSWVEASIES
jgi:hypothetical protein